MDTIQRDDNHLVWTVDQGRSSTPLLLSGGLGLILTLGGVYYLVATNVALGVVTLLIGLPLLAYGVVLWRRESALTITVDRTARAVTLSGADQRVIPFSRIASVTIARSGYQDAPFYTIQLVLDDGQSVPVTARRGRRTPLDPNPRPAVTADRDEIARYLDLP